MTLAPVQSVRGLEAIAALYCPNCQELMFWTSGKSGAYGSVNILWYPNGEHPRPGAPCRCKHCQAQGPVGFLRYESLQEESV